MTGGGLEQEFERSAIGLLSCLLETEGSYDRLRFRKEN